MTDDDDARRRARADAARINLPPCHSCGYLQDGISPAHDEGPEHPDVGALVVCIACGALAIVAGSEGVGLYVRPLTPVEHRQALADADVIRVLTARAVLQARAGGDWRRLLG